MKDIVDANARHLEAEGHTTSAGALDMLMGMVGSFEQAHERPGALTLANDPELSTGFNYLRRGRVTVTAPAWATAGETETIDRMATIMSVLALDLHAACLGGVAVAQVSSEATYPAGEHAVPRSVGDLLGCGQGAAVFDPLPRQLLAVSLDSRDTNEQRSPASTASPASPGFEPQAERASTASSAARDITESCGSAV